MTAVMALRIKRDYLVLKDSQRQQPARLRVNGCFATLQEALMTESPPTFAKLEPGEVNRLEALVDYQPGSIVSRVVARSDGGTITLFAFDAGQELSEHSAPFDAYVMVLDGAAGLRIGGRSVVVHTGEVALMPAHVPHGVQAPERCKMLLVMLRSRSPAAEI